MLEGADLSEEDLMGAVKRVEAVCVDGEGSRDRACPLSFVF